jgi:uncharacterized protein involved in outer membrane biogenesis
MLPLLSVHNFIAVNMIKFLKIFGILLLLKTCITLALLFYANARLKEGIESIDSEYFGVSFKIDKVVMHALDGSLEIRGIQVSNPEGFSKSNIFEASKIFLKFQVASLLDPVVVIEEVQILAPIFLYEKTGDKNNVDTLKGMVSKQLTTEPIRHPEKHNTTEPKFYDLSHKKVIISQFNMEESVAKLKVDTKVMLLSSITVDEKITIPKVTASDIGKEKGGITPEEAAEQVGLKVLENVPVQAIEQIVLTQILKIPNHLKNITETLSNISGILNND